MASRKPNPKDIAGREKCPLHLIPGVAEIQVAAVLAHGAAKYGGWNWRVTKIKATSYIAAARRHLAAWLDGEDLDPESGLPHLAHAAAGLMIALDAEAVGTLIDNRPKSGKAATMLTTLEKRPHRTPPAAFKRRKTTR